MRPVVLPLHLVFMRQIGGFENQKVLCISVFCRIREVEAAGDHDLIVDHHDLVVCDLVDGIDVGRDSFIGEKSCSAIAIRAVCLIEDYLHIHASFLGIH